MVDDRHFPPDEDQSAQSADSLDPSAERPATAEQWAAMTFAAVSLDPARFESEWEQARGAMARTAVALLRFDDRALTSHFMQQSEPLRRAMEVHAGLQRELDYLKTHIEALEMAATRVLCVASRCAEQSSS